MTSSIRIMRVCVTGRPVLCLRDAHQERCVLGYNPLKQIAQPRPVGWISTYGSGGGGDGGGNRVAHIAPYSFFGDVARGDRPMVAYAHVYLLRIA
jgi:hypothetical protein